jgi:PKD repeat protein
MENPHHLYNGPGIYNVTLITETDAACSNTVSKNIIVYPLPVANFQPCNSCSGQTISFQDLSKSPSSPIIAWQWKFNDPYNQDYDTSSLQNPIYIYDSTGVYQVTLIITNANGCISSITKEVTVRKTPASDFTYSKSCFGEPVYFADITSTQAYEPIISWQWNFGDGSSSSISNPVHNYDTAQTYNVSLTVQSLNGCYGQITKPVTLHALPVAGFEIQKACEGLPVQFNDISYVNNDTVINWIWSYNNNIFSVDQNPKYIFPTNGSFPVQLIVNTSAGCRDTIIKNVDVSTLPVSDFSFTPDYGVPPLTVNFNNQSHDVNIVYWDFGDGSNSNEYSPEHTYTNTGLFVINLIITNASGCSDTLNKNIYVMPFIADIAVTNVELLEKNGYLVFSADITNYGTINIREVEMKVDINGGIEFFEIWTGLLPPAETVTYNFSTRYKISPSMPEKYVCIKAELTDFNPDSRPDNNENCKAISTELYLAEIYPNPVSNQLTADLILPEDDIVLIKVINVLGKETGISGTFNGIKGVNRYKINTDAINNGVYILQIIYRGKSINKMFVKE